MSDIVIRHAEPRDAEPLRQLTAHPEVYHDTTASSSLDGNVARTSTAQAHSHHLVATLDNGVVGHLMLSVEPRPRRSHVATFGMSVDAAFHGRGVGSALMREMINLCDNWLRVDRIELTVFADNAAARASIANTVLSSKGPRKFALRNGEYVDAHFMARLK
jgi:putative acetyltransferase